MCFVHGGTGVNQCSSIVTALMDSDGFAKSPLFETFSADLHLCRYPERIPTCPFLPDKKLIELGSDFIHPIRHFRPAPRLSPGSCQGRSVDRNLHSFTGGRVTHAGAAHHARFDSGDGAVLERDRSSFASRQRSESESSRTCHTFSSGRSRSHRHRRPFDGRLSYSNRPGVP